jgi:hypothetical protein
VAAAGDGLMGIVIENEIVALQKNGCSYSSDDGDEIFC